MTYIMNQADRSVALTYMWRHWPDAHSMRYVGRCPGCKQNSLWSAVRPADEAMADQPRFKDKGHEPCFHFCTRSSCKFTGMTSRPVTNDELEGGADV